ncbi:hypothetical protein ABIB38_004663 [Massilia sp. UYP11]|uniref:StbB family protein n=1 Tax=Massilia sp. UYP11 TaxID=1756385 RepID=UPI003D2542F5
MKIALINFSGNVGKSTLGRHLFAPRLGVNLISMETHNADEGGVRITSKDFDFVQEHLLDNDAAVVDVGSSNIAGFIQQMTEYDASHEDFDLFVVPVVPAVKQQKDTIATIDALHSIGVPAKKIRVIFNDHDKSENIEDVFAVLFSYAEAEKKCLVRPGAVVYHNDVFENLKAMTDADGKLLTVPALAADKTDYAELRRNTTDEEKRAEYMALHLEKRRAASVNENLDVAFKAVTK